MNPVNNLLFEIPKISIHYKILSANPHWIKINYQISLVHLLPDYNHLNNIVFFPVDRIDLLIDIHSLSIYLLRHRYPSANHLKIHNYLTH